MSANFDELVAGRVYVGSANDATLAIAKGLVEHVFDVRVNGRNEEVNYSYTHSPIHDGDETSTIKSGAMQLAKSYENGEKIYIHCGSGTGRAAVMAAALLMETGQSSSIDVAIEKVKNARRGANFKPNMIDALHELYK